MRLLKTANRLTSDIYFRLLKDNLGLIAGFAVGVEFCEAYFNYMDKMTSGDTSLNMPAKIGLLLTSLMMVVFYALLIPLRVTEYDQGLPRKTIWQFAHETMKPYLLESLRAFAKCLLYLVGGAMAGIALTLLFMKIGWLDQDQINQRIEQFSQSSGALAVGPTLFSLLAILIVIFGPFAFFYLRYTFVGYIVLVDPDYKAGRVDALKRSYELVRSVTRYVIVIFTIMTVLEVIRAKLRGVFPVLQNPIGALLVLIAFEGIGLYFNILLFRIYELRVKEAPLSKAEPARSPHGTTI